MIRNLLLALMCLTMLAARPAAAEESDKPVELKVGDKAPKFEGETDADKAWKSADHVGKKVLVVYFYPADLTGGCTAQACAYRDAAADLKDANVEVIGVSGDSVENHKHFKKEHNLNFTLLADPDGKIAKAFGVKMGPGGVFNYKIDGEDVALERGVTSSRWTFVIDREGRIAHKDDKVNAAKDAANVMKVVKQLAKSDAKEEKKAG